METQKPRVIKDFDRLDISIQEQIKLAYPYGFFKHLISYVDKDGNKKTALPFETDEKYYMVRMTNNQARQIIDDDDDYGSDGILKEKVKSNFEDKYSDLDYMADYVEDEGSSDFADGEDFDEE